MKISGNIVAIRERRIFHGEIEVEAGRIQRITPLPGTSPRFILPGFVDAHVHVESSMLVPSEFARLAVRHGTVATVSDPHEIANVLGIEGVEYMIANGAKVPFKFYFGAPSCVPATPFETAGAEIDAAALETLLRKPEIHYLAEMMNYPGVLYDDPQVLAKLAIAKKLQKPIDGHAPGLRGEKAKRYAAHGISTDHECYSYEEAREKLDYGMHILIREGSAAKNFDALHPLLSEQPERIMFCSDDKHPDDLLDGHINQLAARAVAKGHDVFDVLRAACVNPVQHYHLQVGQLREGDAADFVVVNDLENFAVLETYIDGQLVAKNGDSLIPSVSAKVINNFQCSPKTPEDFQISAERATLRGIHAFDGELVTESFSAPAKIEQEMAVSDTERDVLKITVVNRYADAPPALAFIHGFGLQTGAIASCVGHDSHNIIAVGTTDEELCQAVNLIIENRGGIAAVNGSTQKVLPLPVAGIMTTEDGLAVAQKYAVIDRFAKKELQSALSAPFMTLSFMALLVIPQLKLSDKGLFDGEQFAFASLFVE